MNGLLKKQFGGINKAIPTWSKIQELIPFSERAKTGDRYEELILTKRSHGVTHAKTTRRTGYSLRSARSLETLPAEVLPAELVMREQIAYGMLAAAEAAGEKAYARAVGEAVIGILESHRFYLELNFLYGGGNIGALSVVAGASTTRTWTFTQASWSPGIWAQMENAAVDVYDPTLTTKRNTNADVIITAVDQDLRQVTVSGNATDLTACVATDVLVIAAAKGETCTGIDTILTNTGSLFGIDAATVGIWKSNVISAGGNPGNMQLFHSAINRAVNRGLSKPFTWQVNSYAWQDLMDDATVLRRFASDTKQEMSQGTAKLTFIGVNGSIVNFEPNPMLKCGDAFGLVPDEWIRGGDSDITNGLPGAPSDDMFFDLEGVAAAELRNFSSQFLLCKMPSHQVKISNLAPRQAP
jgi:hypothetical protein